MWAQNLPRPFPSLFYVDDISYVVILWKHPTLNSARSEHPADPSVIKYGELGGKGDNVGPFNRITTKLDDVDIFG